VAPGVRVEVVVMGVDAARFVRGTPPPGRRIVVAVGRLVEKKGFEHLAAAAERLDARVRIVGDGPLRERLAGTRVELLGALAPEEVRAVLEAADVLAMPCVVAADGDRDAMPVVVKEALAMEVPVVASDAVGLPELVRPAWGRLVPPGDAAALAVALDELLALPAHERAAMGRAGRAFVERYCDVATEAVRLSTLLREVAR
jgi:glycosyltransferase involved in cell wall biosynthesis